MEHADPAESPPRLSSIGFDELPGWQDDDHLAAFRAFLPCAKRMIDKPYKTRALGVNGALLAAVAQIAMRTDVSNRREARVFFEEHFVPHRVFQNGNDTGMLTGFYEPIVPASRKQTERFSIPLLKRPPDLIDVDDGNRPQEMDPYFRFGKRNGDTIIPYFDRPAIYAGALQDQNLELVWLENKVDVFFIHVQGAAKLALVDGTHMRVTFDGKSGHPYTSVAKVLCEQEGLDPAGMTADRLSDWMYANPNKFDALLAHNKSYIFFKAVEDLDDELGPVAAAKVPLIAGRSMAVDRTLHTFGSPIWLATSKPLPEQLKPLARLMMAHDTGSAIVGAVRGDYFSGTGDDAGLVAGRIRHQASLTVLMPRDVSK